MAREKKIQYKISFNLDKESVNRIEGDLNKIKTNAQNALNAKPLDSGLKQTIQTAEKLSNILDGSWNQKLEEIDTYKLNSGIREAFGSISNFKSAMKMLGLEGTEIFNEISGSIINTNTQLMTGSKFLNSMATTMKNTVKWGITASIFNNITKSIRGAYGYIQHLDDSLNRIRIVSGESAESMEKFAKQANNAAQALGASTLDYTDAALIYYQQGLDDDQVQKRTETTLKMANVLGIDASEVSNYMTAIWNNFDDGSKSLEYFGDVITSLGANTASSAEEIATGLNKFSAVADTVGLSYEYATSALATVVATTRQSAEVVGTAFKTLFARIQDLELGETLEDGTTLGKYSEGLAAVGISIKDSSGELRNMDDILNDMGEKWNQLNKAQQVALAQTVAGTRLYTQLVALMDNWDNEMQKNLETAANSSGTLESQQKIYMETMTAHLQKLTTQWQRTYDIIFDPDAIIGVTDVLEDILEKFNDFIEGIGGGVNAIGFFATTFTNLFSQQIATSILRVQSNIKAIKDNRDLLKSDKEYINKMAAKEVMYGNDQAGVRISSEAGLKKEVELYTKILKNARYLTAEQQAQAKEEARKVALLIQQAGYTKKAIENARERYEVSKEEVETYKEKHDIDKDSLSIKLQELREIEKEQQNALKESSNKLANSKSIQDDFKARVENLRNSGTGKWAKEIKQENLEEWISNLEKADKSITKLEKSLMKAKAASHEVNVENGSSHEKANENINKLEEKLKNAIKKRNELVNGKFDPQMSTEEIKEQIQQIRDLRKDSTNRELNNEVRENEQEVKKVNQELTETEKEIRIILTILKELGIVEKGTVEEVEKAAKSTEDHVNSMIKQAEQAKKVQKAIQIASAAAQGLNVIFGAISNSIATSNEELTKEEKHVKNVQTATSVASGLLNTAGMVAGVALGSPMVGMIAGSLAGSIGELVGSIFIKNAKKHAEEVKKAAEQAAQELEESRKRIEDLTSKQISYSTNEVAKEWQTLVSGVDEYGNNISLTNEEYNDYLNYCKEMVEIDDSLVDGYNRQGQAIITNRDAINSINNALKEQIFLQEQQQITGQQYNAQIDEITESSKTAKTELENLYNKRKREIDKLAGEGVAYIDSNGIQYSIEEIVNAINRDYDSLKGEDGHLSYSDFINNREDILKIFSGGENYEVNLEIFEKADKIIQEYSEDIEEAKEKTEQFNEVQALALKRAFYKDENAFSLYNDLSEKQASIVSAYSKTLSPKDSTKSVKEQTKELTEQIQEFEEYLIKTSPETQDLLERIFKLDFETQGDYANAISKIKQDLSERVDSETSRKIQIALEIVDDSTEKNKIEKIRDNIEKAYQDAGVGEIVPNLDAMSIQELQDFDKYLSKLGTKIDKNAYAYFTFSSSVEKTADALNTFTLKTDAAKKALEEFQDKGVISDETLKDLKVQYEELGEYTDTTSHEFIQRVRELREQTEADQMEVLKEQMDTLDKTATGYEEKLEDLLSKAKEFEANNNEEELNRIQVEIEANTEQYEEVMQELLNTEYKIQVQVEADLKSDVDNAFGLADELDKLKSYIPEDLKVTAKRAQEIIEAGYAGILKGAKAAADGSILLNKEEMNKYIDNKQIEIEADKQAKIQQLKNQKEVLVAQQNALKLKLEAIETALTTEDKSKKAQALEEIKTQDSVYKALQEELADDLNKKKAGADDELEINRVLFESLGGFYKTDSENIQKAEKAATEYTIDSVEQRLAIYQRLHNGLKVIASDVWKAARGETITEVFDVEGMQASLKEIVSPVLDSFENVAEGAVNIFKGKLSKLLNSDEGNSELVEKAEKKFISESDTFNATLEKLQKQTKEQIDALDAQISAIDAGIAALEASSYSLDLSQELAKEAAEGTLKITEEQLDRYHDINIALKDIETQLKRVQNAQKGLFGKELTDNLNKQLDLLETQRDLTEQKLKMTKQESQELRSQLSSNGVTFNDDGSIGNYEQAIKNRINYINALTLKYNSMTEAERKSFQPTLDAAKEEYEKFKTAISDYDKIISETIPGLEDSIQSILDKEIEIKISRFDAEVQLRLNMAKAEQDFNNFRRKVIDKIKDDDILGNAKANLKDLTTYFNTAGTGIGSIQAATAQVSKIMEELKQMDATGTSNTYGDNREQALQDLKKYQEQVVQLLENEQDLVDKIEKSYLDTIDEAISEFNKHVEQYEYIRDLLKHDINLVGLLYGDKAYAEMEKHFEKIAENNNKELDFLRRQRDFIKERMDAELNPEAKEKLLEEYQNVTKKINSLLEDAIKNIQDKYSNGINKIFQSWEKDMMNGDTFEWAEESWKRLSSGAKEYLDDINRIYETQSIENKFKDAIDGTNSLAAQSKLTDVMNQQLTILKEKEKINKYDVERANKIYDLTLKQIALEEAQQNKTRMRLRRDGQGNYSFSYVADDDAVKKAQNELDEAKNNLYNFDKERLQANLEESFNLVKEWQEQRVKVLNDKAITDEEERKRKLDEIDAWYGDQMNSRLADNSQYRQNLLESTYMNIEGFQDDSLKSFLNMTDTERDEIMNNLVPTWDSGLQHMLDNFVAEGGFIPACKEAINELDEESKKYEDDLNNTLKAAGEDLDELRQGIDNNVDSTRILILENDNLIDTYRDEMNAIQGVIDMVNNLTNSYNSVMSAATAAATEAHNYWMNTNKAAAAMTELRNGIDQTTKSYELLGKAYSIAAQGALSGTNNDVVRTHENDVNTLLAAAGANAGLGYKVLKKDVDLKPGPDSSEMGWNLGRIPKGTTVLLKGYHENANYPVNIEVGSGDLIGFSGWIKKESYASGGYTGNWNSSEGRLATLHEKELVLNKTDTKNMLSAVEMIRDMDSMFNSIDDSIFKYKLNSLNMLFDLMKDNVLNGIHNSSSNTLDQNVHIEANFPNVKSAVDIETALGNLVNIASQRALSTRR